MKTAFSVEEEGYEDDGEDDEQKNLLQEFINHIKVLNVHVLISDSCEGVLLCCC